LRGTAIQRGSHVMLEVVAGTVATSPAGASAASRPDVERARSSSTVLTPAGPAREITLAGEIVDSKCHLGVMNPGDGTVHRDCASLCLRGGIPPMLRVRDATGDDALVLLVGRDGRAIGPALASIAGLPVTVRGRLTRDARGLVLSADRADYQRLTR
jgi:hypothetical protein